MPPTLPSEIGLCNQILSHLVQPYMNAFNLNACPPQCLPEDKRDQLHALPAEEIQALVAEHTQAARCRAAPHPLGEMAAAQRSELLRQLELLGGGRFAPLPGSPATSSGGAAAAPASIRALVRAPAGDVSSGGTPGGASAEALGAAPQGALAAAAGGGAVIDPVPVLSAALSEVLTELAELRKASARLLAQRSEWEDDSDM